ncbi:type I polyketide synthase [Albimonas pacifica]|uniref:Acyl transferase domain-containing protein n=1 Tax=Albimonas pacifica TaxID=1114924 RepID=A0A1I3DB70_9RHOB|nr:type I polyketide synthase [Albimonas pacifica]SFH83977.1 Acyl transferase domain-containing protein [Albimonas pacifica]
MTSTSQPHGEGEARMRDLLDRAAARLARHQADRHEGIAVVGLAARFPGAPDLDAFWDLLDRGESGLQRVDAADLAAAGLPAALLDDPDYVPVWGGPPEADGFDADLFGYAPREAELLDPQQRMVLECAWHALEDAGRDPAREPGRVGVWAGASLSSHLLRAAGRAGRMEAGLANIAGMVAARVSWRFGLTGPSVGVQTTCSTALTAIHMAVQALRRRECDLALAAAAAVDAPRPEGYAHQAGGVAAPDGVCRPFDAAAAGTVFANGCGVVVLRRLSDALADGDPIRGVILGSAIGSDGADKVGLTAPSVSGQAAVLSAALADARLGAEALDCIEAHGAGTALGDPIEVAALTRAHGEALETAGRRCTLGSVKGNVGHLDAAAGMAGLAKLLLAFSHDRFPSTANYAQPNPKCAFGPFEVSAEARPWPRDPHRPRRAGLSSFGMGGANAHLVIEEPPRLPAAPQTEGAQLLPLSARTPEALARLGEDLAAALEAGEAPLADVAFTLQVGRRPLPERRAVVAATREAAIAALRAPAEPLRPLSGAPEPVFVFAGQGAQRAGMARDLRAAEPAFRETLDACLDLAPAELVLPALMLDPAEPRRIHETRAAQPALFALELALARMWIARGVVPTALIGHSVGELAAACLAGVMDLEGGMRLAVARGALMQACPRGAMLSAMISEAEAEGALPEGVELAAVNGPRSVTLAGPEAAIAELAARLERSGVGCRPLQTSHAFHSAAMEPAMAPFREAVAGVALRPPEIPIVSTLTGDWLTAAEATDPDRWSRQLRRPVRYGEAVARLREYSRPLLLEIGPGAGLIRLARQALAGDDGPESRGVASLPEAGARDGAAEVLRATGELWAAGAPIDWPALHPAPRRRVPLPGYPFQRRPFWLPPASAAPEDPRAATDPARWTHQPSWRRLPAAAPAAPPRRLLLGAAALDPRLDRPLAAERLDLPPEADSTTLREALEAAAPEEILCAWGLDETAGEAPGALLRGAVALGRALAGSTLRPRLTLVGAGMQDVAGREPLDPGAAMAAGLVPALAQELPGLVCRSLDLDLSEPAGPIRGLADALNAPFAPADALALRGGRLWRREWEAAPSPEPETLPALHGRAAVIVGDLASGLTLAFARAAREAGACGVALLGAGAQTGQGEGRLADGLRALAAPGFTLHAEAGDPTDAAWLGRALDAAEARLGPLAGVFHTGAMGDASLMALAEAEPAALTRLVEPRLRGVAALRRALAGRDLAFCLVQSSLSVLAGGAGLGPYAAANAGIEAIAALAGREGPTAWQAVQWDAAETGSLAGHAGLSTLRILSEAEVARLTRAILARPGASLVAVTPGPLARRLSEADRPPAEPPAPRRRTRPLVPPRDDTERAVVAVMSQMLGVPEIGVEDDFFELGGHSLLAIQIVDRLRRDFGVELPVRALLQEQPSAAGIAAALREARAKADEDGRALARMLDEIETSPADGAA